MAKNNYGILVVILLVVVAVFIFKYAKTGEIFAVTGAETMTRTLPSTAQKGSTFTLTWNVIGATGTYGFLIEDTMGGGCKFSDGSVKYIGIITNPETSKSLQVTAPATTEICTFTGSYDIGNVSHKTFATQNVNIICTPDWDCSAFSACSAVCDWTSKDTCLASYTASGSQTRTCSDLNVCGVACTVPAICGTSQTCSLPCTRIVNKNTLADTNCDNIVKRQELLNYLQSYIEGGVQKEDLLIGLQAWIDGGGQ